VRLRLGTILRIVLAAGLTAWVVWTSHPAAIGAALAGTSWPWVLAACLLVVVEGNGAFGEGEAADLRGRIVEGVGGAGEGHNAGNGCQRDSKRLTHMGAPR
jgi:hypothetical protein